MFYSGFMAKSERHFHALLISLMLHEAERGHRGGVVRKSTSWYVMCADLAIIGTLLWRLFFLRSFSEIMIFIMQRVSISIFFSFTLQILHRGYRVPRLRPAVALY